MISQYVIDPLSGERTRVMRTIVNERTYDPGSQVGEDYTGITSKTVPGMSLTMQEIIQRHVAQKELPDQGRMFNGDALYPDGTPMPDFARMSKAEIHQFAKDNLVRVELIQRNIAEANRRREEERFKAEKEELENLRKQKTEWEKLPKGD